MGCTINGGYCIIFTKTIMKASCTMKAKLFSISLITLACASCANLVPPVAEETRPHDTRIFTADATQTTFAAMAANPADVAPMTTTSRWAGVQGGASYMVEVPANWNGKLVMFAHGYRGTGANLTVNPPQIRRHLIQSGYAWAASSYSKNYYDVRAGVEDTNALANAFTKIAEKNGRVLVSPSRLYITGVSMGGHITAAAIEAETAATAINKTQYHGAVPMCGVTADTELFDIFMKQQTAALAEAAVPNAPTDLPLAKWSEVQVNVSKSLFASFPSPAAPATPIATTPQGDKFVTAVKYLTGGERPLFKEGMSYGGSFRFAYGGYGGDGTINGILSKSFFADSNANRPRTDGLRWIPVVNGEFKVPVVTLHTLGDLYVPFAMTQLYQKRVAARGNAGWLVQRAIRGAAHCDFTVAEQVQAFDDMVRWEQAGVRPAGDDVLNATLVAAPSYGCSFTKNAIGQDDSPSTRDLRTKIAVSTPACSAN
jgi:hypothetical protein